MLMVALKRFLCSFIITVCNRNGNSGRDRIAIIWPEPEPNQHPTKQFSYYNFIMNILVIYRDTDRILCKPQKEISKLDLIK